MEVDHPKEAEKKEEKKEKEKEKEQIEDRPQEKENKKEQRREKEKVPTVEPPKETTEGEKEKEKEKEVEIITADRRKKEGEISKEKQQISLEEGKYEKMEILHTVEPGHGEEDGRKKGGSARNSPEGSDTEWMTVGAGGSRKRGKKMEILEKGTKQVKKKSTKKKYRN